MGSFLAYELKALEDAPMIARGAGIAEDSAIAGNARMWAWCWRSKCDVVSLLQIGGFYGSNQERVAAQLIAFGYLEDLSDGRFRVRGAERYLRISRTRSEAGAKGGKKTAATGKGLGNLRSKPEANASEAPKQTSSNAEALPPSTEHRASSTDYKPKKLAPASPPPASSPEQINERRAYSDALCAEFKARRGVEYVFDGAKDGVALTWLQSKATQLEAVGRFGKGLDAGGWYRVSTIAQLRTKWNDLVGDLAGKQDVRKGRVGVEHSYPPQPGKMQDQGFEF